MDRLVTHASNQCSQLLQSLPLSCWKSALLILAVPMPLCQTMQLHSCQQNFKNGVKERGIVHLTGALYHPATNGSAQQLVQSFKQALKKSPLPPQKAFQEFLIQYRHIPLSTGFSRSELLKGRQIPTKIDTFLPSPAHIAQRKHTKGASKSQHDEMVSESDVKKSIYNASAPVCAAYYGPRRDEDARWVPAIVVKWHGSHSISMSSPRGPVWRRHLEHLQPHHMASDAAEPGGTMYNSHNFWKYCIGSQLRSSHTRIESGFRHCFPCTSS